MFKKNPNRPQITISLKKVHNGYKVIHNEAINPFSFKRITRAVFRSDLYQGTHPPGQGNFGGINSSTSIVQPPLHLTIPSFSRWFDLDKIHDIEKQQFPEFFLEEEEQGKLFRKTPKLYKFYRNYIITLWRQNSKKYLSPGVCRKNLSGDVSCIMRIHAFLEHWGLINFPSKEHAKGFLETPAQNYYCLVCEATQATTYYIAQIQNGLILQLCDCCFYGGYYPDFLQKQDFKKIIPKIHENKKRKIMSPEQIKKLLEIMASDNQRERQMWANVTKQLPNYTKQEIMLNFLEIPAEHKMNYNIFQSAEDVIPDSQPQSFEQPTVFEDYENPEQAGIAICYYQWKKNPQRYPQLSRLFNGAERHSRYLAQVQKRKINEMIRMLTDLQQSKLELKTIFLQEYEKLLQAQEKSSKKVSTNIIAEMIKNVEEQEFERE